jgi:hypothetical protein
MTGNSEQGGEIIRRVDRMLEEIERDVMGAHPAHRKHLQTQWANALASLRNRIGAASDRLRDASMEEAA